VSMVNNANLMSMEKDDNPLENKKFQVKKKRISIRVMCINSDLM
jgi:hypothetical protein